MAEQHRVGIEIQIEGKDAAERDRQWRDAPTLLGRHIAQQLLQADQSEDGQAQRRRQAEPRHRRDPVGVQGELRRQRQAAHQDRHHHHRCRTDDVAARTCPRRLAGPPLMQQHEDENDPRCRVQQVAPPKRNPAQRTRVEHERHAESRPCGARNDRERHCARAQSPWPSMDQLHHQPDRRDQAQREANGSEIEHGPS
jgi:hypothetical protein